MLVYLHVCSAGLPPKIEMVGLKVLVSLVVTHPGGLVQRCANWATLGMAQLCRRETCVGERISTIVYERKLIFQQLKGQASGLAAAAIVCGAV